MTTPEQQIETLAFQNRLLRTRVLDLEKLIREWRGLYLDYGYREELDETDLMSNTREALREEE